VTAGVLTRRLGTADAVVIGLGSMIGAGVFSAFAPAAAAAGSGLLLGLALAAGVAYCNAVASAQLAVQYPTSGGTYVYGRERLGDWWGFLAGFGFVVGKTASCAAMALTFGAYVAPGSDLGRRGAAVAAVAALTAANLRGISRTARLTRVLVTLSLAALAVVLAAIATSGHLALSNLGEGRGGPYGVLQSAGLLFFAFAGYARIATLGEEVRDPERTIPRAIPLALGLAVGVYLLVALAALGGAGPATLAASTAPVAAAADAAAATWALPVVRAGAAVASLGALLALIAGVGRTALAMARNGDLPRQLAAVDTRRSVPARAELAVAVVVAVLVSTTDLRGAIGFSSFGVLVYYAVANASAFTQRHEHRRWPRALNVAGMVGCVTLAATLPLASVAAGVVVLGTGLAGRAILGLRGSTSGRRARASAPDRPRAGTAGGCSRPREPSSRAGRPTGSPPAS
jgi:APA family basic amino acid/polyamine antiporter